MRLQTDKNKNEAGFSLIELTIAMATTLVLLMIATTVLSSGFRIRDREESVTDAVADSQRALNIMSREIANAGFNLKTNGLVDGDSNSSSIRIRSNLNKYDSSATYASQTGVIDAGEDLKYFVNVANNTQYLVRHDANASSNKTTVLANRLDQIRIHYFSQKVTYSTFDCDISSASGSEVTPSAASYVVLAVCVRIPAFGRAGSAGYQPASRVLLVSDIVLRNSLLSSY
jgi:Tfp pilus assembly protein PilW